MTWHEHACPLCGEVHDLQRLEAAIVELRELTRASEAYMRYHEQKFYSEMSVKPTGLWPAIRKVKSFLASWKSAGR